VAIHAFVVNFRTIQVDQGDGMIGALTIATVLFAAASDEDEPEVYVAQFHLLRGMGDLEGAYAALVEAMRPRHALALTKSMCAWVIEAKNLDDLGARLDEHLIARDALDPLLRACPRNDMLEVPYLQLIGDQAPVPGDHLEVQMPVFAKVPAGFRCGIDRNVSLGKPFTNVNYATVVSWDATRVMILIERKSVLIPLEKASYVGTSLSRVPVIREPS
jgi:hypothetical protein